MWMREGIAMMRVSKSTLSDIVQAATFALNGTGRLHVPEVELVINLAFDLRDARAENTRLQARIAELEAQLAAARNRLDTAEATLRQVASVCIGGGSTAYALERLLDLLHLRDGEKHREL